MKNDDYSDIIHLSHHVSLNRTHMSQSDRAAQFAPFAALTGHESAICEKARHTDEKPRLAEDEKTILNEKLRYLINNANSNPIAEFTFFVSDKSKSGGKNVSHSGIIKKIDACTQTVTLFDGTEFAVDDIIGIESEAFYGWI